MAKLETFRLALVGGIQDSKAIPDPSDLQTLTNMHPIRGRFGLRAPLRETARLLCAVADESGQPVDTVLGVVHHVGYMYAVAHRGAPTNKTYLYKLKVDGTPIGGGTTEVPLTTIWAGSAVPEVNFASIEGGTAFTSVDRLYIADYALNYDTVYYDGSTVTTVAEDLDDNGAKENIRFQLIFTYQYHVWGTGFYMSGATDRPELARFSRPGLIAEIEPDVLNNTSREWWFIDQRPVGRRGEEFRGVGFAGGSAVLYKSFGVYRLYGYDSDSWAVTPISNQDCCVGPKAVCWTSNGVSFSWGPTGPFMCDGSSIQEIGDPIRRRIQEIGFTSQVVASYSPDDRLVYFGVPSSGSGSPDMCFVFDEAGRFMETVYYGNSTPDVSTVGNDLFGDSGGPDIALKDHVPDTGITAWEYGGVDNTWQVEVGGSQQRAYRANATGGYGSIARTTNNQTTVTGCEIEVNLKRAGVDSAGEVGIIAHNNSGVAKTVVDGLIFTLQRIDASSVTPRLYTYANGVKFDDFTFATLLWDSSTQESKLVTITYTHPNVTIVCGATTYTAVVAHDMSSNGHRFGMYSDQYGSSGWRFLDYKVSSLSGGVLAPLEMNFLAAVPDESLSGPTAAPSSLTVTGAAKRHTGAAVADLAWTNGDTALGTVTNIYRSLISGFTIGAGTLVDSVLSGIDTYEDNTVDSKTQYYWKIAHVRNGQTSSVSGEVGLLVWLDAPTAIGAGDQGALSLTVSAFNNEAGADLVIENKLNTDSDDTHFVVVTTLTNQAATTVDYNDTAADEGIYYDYRFKVTKSGQHASGYSGTVTGKWGSEA